MRNEEKMMHGGDIYRNQVELDFSVNINPFGVPEQVKKALIDAVSVCDRYPDIKAEALIRAISEWISLPEEFLACGNGASELFCAILSVLLPKRTLLPVPSFYGYERAAKAAGSELIFYELKEQDGFVLTEEFLGALTEKIDLLFLANPNNPVGNAIEPELLYQIAKRCREKNIILVLDECFIAFTGEMEKYSFLARLQEYPNVIVVQAFTKLFAIPGVRLGYLVCADVEFVRRVRDALPEWNLSVFAQSAGVAACREREYVQESVEFVCREREWLAEELRKRGFTVFPSKSNYLLLKTKRSLAEELLKQGILIRDCGNFRGLGKGYYRIAVKKRAENEVLLGAMDNGFMPDGAIQEPAGGRLTGSADLEPDTGLMPDGSVQEQGAEHLPGSRKTNIEYVLPGEIEKRSFAIISEELEAQHIHLRPEEELVIKRVIHTSADFSYAKTMMFSENAVQIAKNLIIHGADIVTDTNMALSGINKKVLARYGGGVHCFMAEEETARLAKERGVTRAAVSMERAAQIKKPVIFVVGNAPTALIQLYEMIQNGSYEPAFIIGVPVGFVNVEAAKELILETQVPHIINRGRKGGSNVAAAICNAILYELGR